MDNRWKRAKAAALEAKARNAPEANKAERTIVAPKHVGGGWYDVAGERVRGREAAESLAEKLNARP